MISLFFNDTGYSIKGDGIEITQSCSPALSTDGQAVFPPLHHLYGICFKALCELVEFSTQEDITVYNDSRVIDELNGVLDPYDATCAKWHSTIHRSVLPAIKACVLFRKKAPDFVSTRVNEGQQSLVVVDYDEIKRANSKYNDNKRARKVERFKEQWYGK